VGTGGEQEERLLVATAQEWCLQGCERCVLEINDDRSVDDDGTLESCDG